MRGENQRGVELKKGQLLIAEPYLGDENFERAVILLCEHNAEGSVGFILNYQTDKTLGDAFGPEWPGAPDAHPIYVGGPVSPNTIHFVHRRPDLIDDSTLVGDGFAWGGDFDQVQELIATGQLAADEVRFFVGYAGWSTDQLAGEVSEQSWIVHDVDGSGYWYLPAEHLWRQLLRDMGGRYRMLSNFPTDPRLN